MPTADYYIAQALARSAAARPDLLATAAGELLEQLNDVVEQLFVDAAEANVPYFQAEATTTLVAGPPAHWPWPSNALRIFGASVLVGTLGVDQAYWPPGEEVAIVPWHDAKHNDLQPCVAERGRLLVPTGVSGHPTGGDLYVSYARRPIAMATLTSTVDPDWPVAHNPAIIDQLAHWLAVKDGRADDVVMLRDEASNTYGRFLASLNLPVAAVRERVQRFRADKPQRMRSGD